MRASAKHIIATVVFILSLTPVSGQFYNGHQMLFGKNRLQHYDFYWSYYRFDSFDCYFNEYGRELADYASEYATKRIAEIEDYFNYFLEKRLILVIHNKQADFKQSNIGLITGQDDYNISGYSQTIKNKVMIYYEGDHEAFERQISEAITEVMINEMLYDADKIDRVSGSSVITLPDWYIKGLKRHVAFGWDEETENRVRDGFENGRYKKLMNLEYEDATFAGHSFWRFIADTYGEQIIPSIIYLSKIYKNVDEGLMYVLGLKLKEIEKEWREWYREYYSGTLIGSPTPRPENLLEKTKKRRVIQDVKISPDNRYVSWVTYDRGRRIIRLHDTETGREKKVFARDPRFDQKPDNTYPVLGWHPGGDILTFINEEKGRVKIYFYRPSTGDLQDRNLLYFDKVLSFDYAPSGNRIVMSAVKDGLTDIYIHTLASGTNQQVTRDLPDDLNPRYIKGEAGRIIFSSNRLNDTLSVPYDPGAGLSPLFNLFSYDPEKDDGILTMLEEGRYSSRKEPLGEANRTFTYLGNENGTINRFRATFDSTIAYIDTTTHFRYFINSDPLTNYNRNIETHDATPSGKVAQVLFENNSYNLYFGETNSRRVPENEIIISPFRKEQLKALEAADSINTLRQWLIEQDRIRRDTMTRPLYEYYATDEPIDINHYIFEKEKQNLYEMEWRKDYLDIDITGERLSFPPVRIYQTTFYNNYIAFQADFSFLNNSYQVYSGGAPWYNPGLNMLTKIGIVDLFENYRVTGGFRLSADFNSNEYLLSIENLRHLTNKQLIYHKQVFSSVNDTAYFKINSQNRYLVFTRPFTPALAVKGTVFFRSDRYIPQSTDISTLNADDFTRHWAGLKAELIYDNTIKRTSNIYFGTRFKIFGEYFRDIGMKKSDMFVVGGDFRHYLRIHRDLIWANRLAFSSSFGPTRLIYYLGGVDNWMGYFFNKIPMFDNSVAVNPELNYGFQALATNMRGFSQNARNGPNFALINSEIRWPVIRYFAGHPVRSRFLDNLQVVAFGDIGSAWNGLTPWSGDNEWEKEVVTHGPVTITLDTMRDPLIGGFGFGVRSMLAGYFIRADWAWGVENSDILPRVFYLSLSLDF